MPNNILTFIFVTLHISEIRLIYTSCPSRENLWNNYFFLSYLNFPSFSLPLNLLGIKNPPSSGYYFQLKRNAKTEREEEEAKNWLDQEMHENFPKTNMDYVSFMSFFKFSNFIFFSLRSAVISRMRNAKFFRRRQFLWGCFLKKFLRPCLH